MLIPIEPQGSIDNRQGFAMQVVGPGRARTEGRSALTDSARKGRLLLSKRRSEVPVRSPRDTAQAPARQREASVIRRRCARAAERIRRSSGVAHHESGMHRAPVEGRPWPRLFLWVFACAALVVSLIIRADGLDDRDPGAAVRAAATERSWATRVPVLSAIIRRGEAGALSPRYGPES